MISKEIEQYISTRYPRFLEYSEYHSSLAGLCDQGSDVLHEVLCALLVKDEKYIEKLYNKKGAKGLRELDFFILRMIKLNCHSKTSPYRWKYRQGGTDENKQVSNIESTGDDEWWIDQDTEEYEGKPDEEDTPEDQDKNEIICARYEIVRQVLKTLEVTEKEKEVFRWKFFHECTWKEWKGKDNPRHLQATYRKVRDLVITQVRERKSICQGIVTRSMHKSEAITAEYKKTLFPGVYIHSRRYKKALQTADRYLILLKQLK